MAFYPPCTLVLVPYFVLGDRFLPDSFQQIFTNRPPFSVVYFELGTACDARQGQGLSVCKNRLCRLRVWEIAGSSLVAEIARRNGVFPLILPSAQASSGTIFRIRLTASFQILSSEYLLIVHHSALYILNYIQRVMPGRARGYLHARTGFVGFVFGRSQVQVWLRRLLDVTESFHGFLPSVHASSSTIFRIRMTASFQILSSKYLLIVHHSALYILNYIQRVMPGRARGYLHARTGFVGFVFGRSQVQVWLRRSLDVTESFHGFLPSVQASFGTIFRIRLTASFQILSSKYLLIVRDSALYILNYIERR